MSNKKGNISSNFVNFGSYSAEEVAILKPELEKKGIPVKVVYPGTNVGRETTAYARWTAYTILVRGTDLKSALEVCKRLNIKPRGEIPLPKLLYTRINRYLFGVIIAIWLIVIILGNLGILQNELFIGVLIGILFLTYLLFVIITSHKIIRRYNKEKE